MAAQQGQQHSATLAPEAGPRRADTAKCQVNRRVGEWPLPLPLPAPAGSTGAGAAACFHTDTVAIGALTSRAGSAGALRYTL
ncbi:MAG TPA: hypothetical protein PLF91_10495, partial [Mycolicibacterium fallax]|nr:hypothetical protein [Mycolicibacterium fallax]